MTHRDYQPLVPNVAVPKPESSTEDPCGLPTRINKEEESSVEGLLYHKVSQVNCFKKHMSTYAPENESAVTLATAASKLRSVKNE